MGRPLRRNFATCSKRRSPDSLPCVAQGFGPFGSAAADLRVGARQFTFRYRSAEHWLDVFRTWYGPIHKAFAALPAEAQCCLEEELIDLIAEFNRSGDATVVVPSAYLEVVVVKK
jgi:hypothetical protein